MKCLGIWTNFRNYVSFFVLLQALDNNGHKDMSIFAMTFTEQRRIKPKACTYKQTFKEL